MIIKRAMELEMTTQHNPMNEDDSFQEYWLEWSPWTSCSATCGTGAKLRTRGCMASRVCNGLRYDYSMCRGAPCIGNAIRDTKFMAIGAIILINVSMIFCILTPFIVKLIRSSTMKTDKPKEVDLKSGNDPLFTDSLLPSPILVDEKHKSPAKTSLKPSKENTIKSYLIPNETYNELAHDSSSSPSRDFPRKKLFTDSPMSTSIWAGLKRKLNRSNPQRETRVSIPESTGPTTSHSKKDKLSFIERLKKSKTKRKVVDIDVDKLYKYRPEIVEPREYEYRPPGFNDNQHCNVHVYRVDNLAEVQDEFRPSSLVEYDKMSYRINNLMECQTESYRPELMEEQQPMDIYRLNSFEEESFTYRTTENVASNESILEHKDDSPLESKTSNKSEVATKDAEEKSPLDDLQERTKFVLRNIQKELSVSGEEIKKKESDVSLLSEKDTDSQVFSEQPESNIEDFEQTPRETISTEIPRKQNLYQVPTEFQEQKLPLLNKVKELISKPKFIFRKISPTKEPLLQKYVEDRTNQTSELLSMESWSSIMSRIKEEQNKLEYRDSDEMAKSAGVFKRSGKRQRRKNVSFALSSEVKYISQPSSESSGKESNTEMVSSSSSETLFKPRIPKVDKNMKYQSSESSDESTLFVKANKSNNSKMKVKQIYKNLVQKFFHKNLNNSSKILETSSQRNLSAEMEAISKQDENCQESKNHEPKHENSSDSLPQVFGRSSSDVVSKFISRVDKTTARNTNKNELPEDEKASTSNDRLNIADRFVYEFNEDEKSVITGRRELLWSSSSSEQSNSNPNNSDF